MAAAVCCFVCCRKISTSVACHGKKNFRKFMLHNKRGTVLFKKAQAENPDPDIPIYHYGVRPIGYIDGRRFVKVPEMIPELMVPDLKDFKLKPYVSYRAPDVVQSEFTARDLFDAVYRNKIIEDLNKGKLDASGKSMEPSAEEQMTPEEAWNKARSVGNDICGKQPRSATE